MTMTYWHDRYVSCSTFERWCRFNFVGAIGIAVQFAVLFLLKSVLHRNYLAATAIAVEVAVLHNFVWHEQFTWADRTGLDTKNSDRTNRNRSNPDRLGVIHENFPPRRWLRRLLCFNLSNGAISILGNVALMKVTVGEFHLNYLVANSIAIAVCSLANFFVGNTWVFEER